MAPASFELQLKISSAKDLKNVNWRHGSLKPFVSAWVEPNAKFSTEVHRDGDTSPSWNETLQIPVPSSIDDLDLYLEIVHDKSDGEDDTKLVVGSARLPLREVGFGVVALRSLELRRPSGRHQGKVDVEISVKDLQDLQDLRFRGSDGYYACPAVSNHSAIPTAHYPCQSPQAPSVHAFPVLPNLQHVSYAHVAASAEETGMQAEMVSDAGAVAGAYDGQAKTRKALRSVGDIRILSQKR